MKSIFKNNRGETLAETIIALMILAIGITFSGVLMANSLGNISSSKNRIVAVNIAREGLEIVRNIRDSNWLRFSGNRRDCWNHLPGPSSEVAPDTCDGSTLIVPDDYIVYKDENQRWRLWAHGNADGFNNADLYAMDIDLEQDTNGDQNFSNDPDLYNHQIAPASLRPLGGGEDPLGFLNATRTPFRRVITLDYLANDGTVLGAGGSLTEAFNRMVVRTQVIWIEGNREFSVELTTYLTDYLGRDNLSS